jgi:hypothetical protein
MWPQLPQKRSSGPGCILAWQEGQIRDMVVAATVSASVLTMSESLSSGEGNGLSTKTVGSVAPFSDTVEPHFGQKVASAGTVAVQLGQVMVCVASSVFVPGAVSAKPHFLQKASPS